MNTDIIFLLISILILIVFGVVIGLWFVRNSKPLTLNDTEKGTYKLAQLNQLCVRNAVSETVPGQSIMLPGFFSPQECDETQNLECILVNEGDPFGYCKSKVGNLETIGGQCYTVYDCAPAPAGTANSTVTCQGGRCTTEAGGILFSSCTIGNSGTNVSCVNNTQYTCINGICLHNTGYPCLGSTTCVSGICDPVTKLCINPFEPAQPCDSQNCVSGFYCSFTGNTGSPENGICQPIVGVTGGNYITVPNGSAGAFCSIPLYSGASGPTLLCDDGLLCNFDSETFTPTQYPGLTGYGLCGNPILPIDASCASTKNACIPSTICSSALPAGASGPVCQAAVVGGSQNINFCGLGSSTLCGSGYECSGGNTGYCLPTVSATEQSGLCNTSIGTCVTGSCSGNKIGIFNRYRYSLIGSTGGHLGEWSYIDIPQGALLPSNTSGISVYQYMSIDGNGAPVINTRMIYFEQLFLGFGGFWYTEFSGPASDATIVWQQVIFNYPISPSYTGVLGVKFTSSGNITVMLEDVTPNAFVNVYTVNNINSGYFDLDVAGNSEGIVSVVANQGTPINFVINPTWDVDDRFNMGVAIGITEVIPPATTGFTNYLVADITIIPGGKTINAVLGLAPGITSNYISGLKYFQSSGGKSTNNFYATVGTIINTWQITDNSVSPPAIYSIDGGTVNGMGMANIFNNNSDRFEMFYISDNGLRYYNLVNFGSYKYVDYPLLGYTPQFSVGNVSANTIDMGNIDENLYALMTLCE